MWDTDRGLSLHTIHKGRKRFHSLDTTQSTNMLDKSLKCSMTKSLHWKDSRLLNIRWSTLFFSCEECVVLFRFSVASSMRPVLGLLLTYNRFLMPTYPGSRISIQFLIQRKSMTALFQMCSTYCFSHWQCSVQDLKSKSNWKTSLCQSIWFTLRHRKTKSVFDVHPLTAHAGFPHSSFTYCQSQKMISSWGQSEPVIPDL